MIKAPPETVFAAITRPAEFTQWWANRAVAEPAVGSLVELRFDNGEVMTMEITGLAAGEKVSWLVRQAAQYAHLWEGTTITWDLAPLSTGTRLSFGHHGFAAIDAGYEQTRSRWDYFPRSLTAYLETGTGTPYVHTPDITQSVHTGDTGVMSRQPAAPDERYTTVIEALLGNPDVTLSSRGKKGFGSAALQVNGKIFAMLVGDTLVVSGDGARFAPRRDGRLMAEWLAIDALSDVNWLALAREATGFVAPQR